MKHVAQLGTRRIQIYLAVISAFMAMWGCTPPAAPRDKTPPKVAKTSETTSTGEIYIGIDVTMASVVQQLVDGFHLEYPEAKLNVVVGTEDELVPLLLSDSLRLVVMSRDLRPAEAAPLRKRSLRVRTTQIGIDAVVAVIHPENPQDSLSSEQLGRLLRGEARTWRDIGGDNDEVVHLVFDAPSSSTVRLLRDKYLKPDQQLPQNAFQAADQGKVLDYVAQNKHAVGFVGYCEVADHDDPRVKARLQQVKLARMDATDTSDAGGYFIRPYQNELALGRYPLSRPIYTVTMETFAGLGTGFVNYAAGEIGQRILLKAGLVPEFMPPRLVILPEKED